MAKKEIEMAYKVKALCNSQSASKAISLYSTREISEDELVAFLNARDMNLF